MNLAPRTRLAGSAVIAALVAGAALAAPSATLATKPAPEHKVTICHRTDSNTNPYVVETVDIASSGHLKGGHDTQHEGPIWDPTLKAQKIEWGDIIPPYTYLDFSYPGQNWTTEGPDLLRNGCVAVAPETVPSPDPSDAVEPSSPSGQVEGQTGSFDPTPPPTDTALAADHSAGDPSPLLIVLAAAAIIGGLGADRARARARH